jgi:hypothetical protein
METMRESWTDARLDDFRAETIRRFDTLERRMDDGFNRVDERLHAMQRTMIQVAVGMSAAFIAGFAALIGLIASQL